MRFILFVATDVMHRTSVHDERAPGGLRRESYERYTEQRELLSTFGKLLLERTSGTHLRVQTPPEGFPSLSPAKLRELEETDTERRVRLIIGMIPSCDFVAVPADSGIPDPLARVIEAALAQGKPVMIMHTDPPRIVVETTKRFEGRPGVTYIAHGNLKNGAAVRDLRRNIVRFTMNLPSGHKADAG
ncbi:MAG TPA: hypothetical protein VMU11_03080 [Verrucomicrobiae bacterium]|nr:hypothetical protein [Verrucomicrobiae bacterium]